MSVIGNRYSEALVSLAQNETELKEFNESLHMIADIFDANNQMAAFFSSPLITKDEKKQALSTAFTQSHPHILNLLFLLVDKNRMNYFMDIKASYNQQVNQILGIEEGVVYSLRPLDPTEIDNLQKAFSKKLNKQVLLTNQTDENVISGVRVEINEKVYDGTLQKELKTLTHYLNN